MATFAPVMSQNFLETFTEFLNSLSTFFIQRGNFFHFPDKNFSIRLINISDFTSNEAKFYSKEACACSKEECSNDFFSSIAANLPETGVSQTIATCDKTGNTGKNYCDILYLYEDRWNFCRDEIKKRILARLGNFNSIFARKCKLVANRGRLAPSQTKERENTDRLIKEFIEKYHSYGYAKSKYRYALIYNGEIVAAAAFSAPRPIPRIVGTNKGESSVVYDSYEWVRYVSLPDSRVIGGMGKLLGAFVNDVRELGNPVEIMSYSDNEWSNGDVYIKLGFEEVEGREPITYYVNKGNFERLSHRKLMLEIEGKEDSEENYYIIKNRGSRKFLLKVNQEQP